jgi:hypothetical protein
VVSAAKGAILLCGKPLSSPIERRPVAGIGIARTTPRATHVRQKPEGAPSLTQQAIARLAE